MSRKHKYYQLDETGVVGDQTVATDRQKTSDVKRTSKYIQQKKVGKTNNAISNITIKDNWFKHIFFTMTFVIVNTVMMVNI